MSFLQRNISVLNATNFADSFDTNDYYIFLSSINESETINSITSENVFADEIVFGKKADAAELYYMIKDNPWTTGVAYDQYDNDSDLSGDNYFVTVYPEDEILGEYYVFKCLFNNFGSNSTDKPVYTPETPNQVYYTQDGYVWQYKYTISGNIFQKYYTNGYIPVIEPETPQSYNGVIRQIFVDNYQDNYGYNEVAGTVTNIFTVNGVKRIYLSNAPEEFDDYYRGQGFYVTAQTGESKLFEIVNYQYDEALDSFFVTITDVNDIFVAAGCVYKIAPKIKIQGDGTGASAIPIIENGRITKIQMITLGSNYTRAIAEVVDPLYGFITEGLEITGLKATLSVILNKTHESLSKEFKADVLLIFDENIPNDNNFLPNTNFYSKMGLIKNPEFRDLSQPARFDNRIKIDVGTTTQVSVGDILTQTNNNETVFKCEVHDKDDIYLWLIDYNGPYQYYNGTDFSLDPNLPLRTDNGDILVIQNVGSIVYPAYVQRSGEILYINNFDKIERTSTSTEKYKILLQF